MEYSKGFWRGLFLILLIATLCGGLALPAMSAPARAAPPMQATACTGTTITQWNFINNDVLPSVGSGTFSVGTGLPAPTFAAGNPDSAVSFNSWTSALDTSKYVDLLVSTSGRKSIVITFDYRSTGAGPTTLELHYSIDGTSFSLFNSPSPLNNNSTFHPLSFDLSTIAGLDNNATAKFRLYGYGATSGTGTLRLDNITFTGNCLTPIELTGTASVVDLTNTAAAANATGTAASNLTATSVALSNTPTPTATPTNTATPTGFLSILINEVAWAGTAASTDDEWIELYNPGASPVDLTGWILKGADGTPNIALTGMIPAGGFYLLERTDDTTVVDATANLIYSGALANSDEILQLIDASNRVIDQANGNGGAWPAGNSTTFNSMERRGVIADSDTAWITNVQSSTWMKHDARGTTSTNYLIHGTPGYGNWAVSVTPTFSPTPSKTPTSRPPPTKTPRPTPLPPPPLVAINEFVPRPGHDWNGDGVINVGDEYIELLNHGVIDVNLSGYSLDDEVNIGSPPYPLPAITLKPGERRVFYGSETGLLLSDGGDGVRLLKPNGQLGDAYNYFVVRFPDQSYCRLPDNGGLDDWNQNCFPTPGLQNSLSGSSVNPPTTGSEESLCPIADTLPYDFVLAECLPFGNNIWNRDYWDKFGWYDEKYLPKSPGKWPVFVD